MLRNIIRKRIKREEGESKIDFILRRQEEVEDAMEVIDHIATIAAIAITMIVGAIIGFYAFWCSFTAPIEKYPVYSGDDISIECPLEQR